MTAFGSCISSTIKVLKRCGKKWKKFVVDTYVKWPTKTSLGSVVTFGAASTNKLNAKNYEKCH